MSTKNIDDLIVKVETEQQQPIPVTQEAIPELNVPLEEKVHEQPSPESEPETLSEVAKEESNESSNVENKAPIDEYGNPTEKPKMYSEEEVQRMIRDRLSRGKHADQSLATEREVLQRTEDFKVDPNSEDNWEVQLENFIEKTIEKKQSKQAQEQWQREELARQADFESKFSTGMNKYGDFREVVSGKNITDSMMLATRSLSDPAAFVYGAAKMHPEELDRIARIPDPYVQASEIGRLHEKMVKNRNTTSNAPKPLEAPKADMMPKLDNMPSLESRIHEYGNQKVNRRR